MATEEAKEQAAALKKDGNAHFQSGKFAEAVVAYTKSIELSPNDHLLLSNRSAAYLKLGESAASALADAEKCIELAPTWPKSYSRQASALQELKRWDEAVAACQRGLSVSSGEGLQKMLEEVRVRQFQSDLQGTWHGTVEEQLGGYEQEMEFMGDFVVRVEVLGRSINGHWSVDPGPSPFHLNIRVPAADVPQSMGAPPPVPYIARIDESGLHLCCPVLCMDRPAVFDGDGYCLMTRGPIESSDDAEVVGLTTREKLFRCVQELTEAVPDTQLKEISHLDTEDTARQKVMVSVRFESAMYAVQKKFGDAVMKEVFDAAKNPEQPHDTLSNTEAMQRLTEKLKASGVLAEEQAPPAPATASPSATHSSAEAAGATASTHGGPAGSASPNATHSSAKAAGATASTHGGPAGSASPNATHSSAKAAGATASTHGATAGSTRLAAAERKVDAGTGAAEAQNGSGIVATAAVLSVAAALATAFVLWRRQRR